MKLVGRGSLLSQKVNSKYLINKPPIDRFISASQYLGACATETERWSALPGRSWSDPAHMSLANCQT